MYTPVNPSSDMSFFGPTHLIELTACDSTKLLFEKKKRLFFELLLFSNPFHSGCRGSIFSTKDTEEANKNHKNTFCNRLFLSGMAMGI